MGQRGRYFSPKIVKNERISRKIASVCRGQSRLSIYKQFYLRYEVGSEKIDFKVVPGYHAFPSLRLLIWEETIDKNGG